MNARTLLRTAAAIGVRVLASPTGLALASSKSRAQVECESQGFPWDPYFVGCGNKLCESSGKKYKAGQTVVRRSLTGDGKTVLLYCDGWSGNWVKV